MSQKYNWIGETTIFSEHTKHFFFHPHDNFTLDIYFKSQFSHFTTTYKTIIFKRKKKVKWKEHFFSMFFGQICGPRNKDKSLKILKYVSWNDLFLYIRSYYESRI